MVSEVVLRPKGWLALTLEETPEKGQPRAASCPSIPEMPAAKNDDKEEDSREPGRGFRTRGRTGSVVPERTSPCRFPPVASVMLVAKHYDKEEDSRGPGDRLWTRGRRGLVVSETASACHSASGNTKTKAKTSWRNSKTLMPQLRCL